jgi:hypothetical protein
VLDHVLLKEQEPDWPRAARQAVPAVVELGALGSAQVTSALLVGGKDLLEDAVHRAPVARSEVPILA